jgi:hypothetical protein
MCCGRARLPKNGDIVVRAEKREAMLVYVLYTAPGADQSLSLIRSRGQFSYAA